MAGMPKCRGCGSLFSNILFEDEWWCSLCLVKEIERLRIIERRWEYVQQHHVRSDGPKMNGQESWIFTGHVRRHKGPTIDAVVDAAIAEWDEYRKAAEAGKHTQ